MGMFNDPVDDQHPDWSISNIGLSSLIGLVFGIVYTLVFTGYRCLYSFSENDYINIMYFPLSFTAIFFILDNANIDSSIYIFLKTYTYCEGNEFLNLVFYKVKYFAIFNFWQ